MISTTEALRIIDTQAATLERVRAWAMASDFRTRDSLLAALDPAPAQAVCSACNGAGTVKRLRTSRQAWGQYTCPQCRGRKTAPAQAEPDPSLHPCGEVESRIVAKWQAAEARVRELEDPAREQTWAERFRVLTERAEAAEARCAELMDRQEKLEADGIYWRKQSIDEGTAKLRAEKALRQSEARCAELERRIARASEECRIYAGIPELDTVAEMLGS